MPDYLFTDPATGQRIKMTGPAPPSEALIRLALAQVQPMASHNPVVEQNTDYGAGARWSEQTQSPSGPPKGLGHLGPLKTPDGGVMSEFSRDDEVNGVPIQYPLIVPTLSKAEVLSLVNHQQSSPSIEAKAKAYALQRLAAGKSPFAAPGEQRMQYPDIPRAPIPLKSQEPPPDPMDVLRNNWSLRPDQNAPTALTQIQQQEQK